MKKLLALLFLCPLPLFGAIGGPPGGGGITATGSYLFNASQFTVTLNTNVSIATGSPVTNPIVRTGMTLDYATASRPAFTDGSKLLISKLIDLTSASDVSVPHANQSFTQNAFPGGTGTGSLLAYGRNLTNTGIYSFVSGSSNQTEGPYNVIMGGSFNIILGGDPTNAVCVIGGGENNQIPLGNNKHGTIGGGQSNTFGAGILGARYGTISGGWVNHIEQSNTFIGGGYKNTNNLVNSTVVGGYSNQCHGAFAGYGSATAPQANFIGGGGGNFMVGSYSVICGGLNNLVATNGTGTLEGNFIGGGLQNTVGGAYACIVGGTDNRITENGGAGFIGSGTLNVIGGDGSGGAGVIGGGFQNTCHGLFSFIGCGNLNVINNASDYSAILGGHNNTITGSDIYIVGANLTGTTVGTVQLGLVDSTKMTIDQTGLTIRGTTVLQPTTLQTIANGGTITANATRVRVAGSGGAITLNATTSIVDASDGQILYIYGTSDVNTVAVPDNSNVQTAGGVTRTLGNRDILVLMFDAANSDWAEVSFSNN